MERPELTATNNQRKPANAIESEEMPDVAEEKSSTKPLFADYRKVRLSRTMSEEPFRQRAILQRAAYKRAREASNSSQAAMPCQVPTAQPSSKCKISCLGVIEEDLIKSMPQEKHYSFSS